MAWFSGKVSLGNFPDLAGAVNKISESVKNIEKNFDSALGFEEKTDTDTSEASGLWPTTDTKALFEPMMAFMGNKGDESTVDSIERPASLEPQPPSSVEEKEGAEIDSSSNFATKQTKPAEEINEESSPLHPASAEDSTTAIAQVTNAAVLEHDKSHLGVPGNSESDSQLTSIDSCNTGVEHHEEPDSITHVNQKETSAVETAENSELMEAKPVTNEADHVEDNGVVPPESHNITNLHVTENEKRSEEGGTIENLSPVGAEDVVSGSQPGMGVDLPSSVSATSEETESPDGHLTNNYPTVQHGDGATQMGSEPVSHEHDTVVKVVDVSQQTSDFEPDTKESVSSGSTVSDIAESVVEVEKLKREMKMMETALQGAARQAQAKADEISRLMNENENLKAVIEDLRRKSSESEIESLREEYHQRVAALERKVYALTKERDTLRREQSKKSDAAALLKEKDEIINQVMAEGEELSKKQAAQESHIRKLRGQIRELEEDKKGLSTKLQVEENKVESIKKDKAATEKLLQETIEKHQAELAAQKEFYTNALNAAKEAEALAEARANNEARTELESRLREAEERETMLVQTLEELRQTLSRKEQQAVFREDMLRRDIEDLQKRYQASERRCEELVTQLPESTRPLLRQIEAMQETTARRAEAWAAVERSLTSRLQDAEAKAAAAEERERSVNERLSQTLSRLNVLEAQISCLRAEQTQLSRTLEKERQRAAENRQEYLAAKEEADTHEGRVSQFEEEIKELRRKHKQELQEALIHREFLQKEIEREKAARLELERNAHLQTSTVSDQSPLLKQKSGFENGKLNRKLSSASSLSSMEESFFLQASLDSSDTFSEHRNHGDMPISPYFVKSFTPSAFEATLRQKEGELASYISRLASLEKIRDSLAEELVKMTEQCEKLRAEAAVLPGIRAELEALRRRHSAALELMGERDEELEELRADIVDMKEMYREQVNLLVNKIQILSSTLGSNTT